jgi:hypothetical protein
MIRWLTYIAFVLYITSCKSIKKAKSESYTVESEEMASMYVMSAMETEKKVFVEEIEEEVTETFTTIQTDTGAQVVPIKKTVVRKKTQSTEERSESDSQTVSQEFVLFKAESDITLDKESSESEAPAKIAKSVLGINLAKIITIILTIGSAVATWYLKKKKAPEDPGL